MSLDCNPIKYRHGEVWIVYISLIYSYFLKLYIIRLATERNNYVVGFVNTIVSSFWYTLLFTMCMAIVIFFPPLNKEQFEVRLLFNCNYMIFRYCNVSLVFDDVPTLYGWNTTAYSVKHDVKHYPINQSINRWYIWQCCWLYVLFFVGFFCLFVCFVC